jgi:hypothetical protein
MRKLIVDGAHLSRRVFALAGIDAADAFEVGLSATAGVGEANEIVAVGFWIAPSHFVAQLKQGRVIARLQFEAFALPTDQALKHALYLGKASLG